jgi:hypothetical protein
MADTYQGKICDRHPEQHGVRLQRNGLCIECARIKKNDRKRRMLAASRDDRIRSGFELGDAHLVIMNIAINCALAAKRDAGFWREYVPLAVRFVESNHQRICPELPALQPDAIRAVESMYRRYTPPAPEEGVSQR